MIEFTGERVVPGQVDADLWNEHMARYEFALRLATGRRVLDAGCGSGYGAARLACVARSAAGIDVSADAVGYARSNFAGPNLSFVRGSCEALPFAGGSFELVTAFEVIEHLRDWQRFLAEIQRVLAPEGLLVISTPNRDYYAEARRQTGPNPYHIHEFDCAEFSGELGARFPSVAVYAENHVAALAFEPVSGGAAELRLGRGAERAQAEVAHFFLAVCGPGAASEARGFVYVPSTANVLQERERHIEKLEVDVRGLRQEKQEMVEMFRQQNAELEKSNLWAKELDEKLSEAQARIVVLQEELAATIVGYEQKIAQLEEEQAATRAGYEKKIAELEEEGRTRTAWAIRLEAELKAKGEDLLKCIALLDAAEKTVIERTAWAQRLEAQMAAIRSSPLVKLAKSVGLGPKLPAE